MRPRHLILSLGLALLLAACGKQQSAAVRPPPIAQATAPARTSAAQQKTMEQASDLPSKITRMNEDGSETVEEVPSDGGAHNPLLAAVASTVAAATASAAAAAASDAGPWAEGVNYTRIVPAQPTGVAPGQVEVLEFFWYACPHCNAIDPLVESWKKTKPAYVSFSRVHVMWNDVHRAHARLFYTLASMGKLDQLHSEIFKEIHVNGAPLAAADPLESERLQAAFVKKFGISEAAFKQTYHSFDVDNAMRKADELVQRYRVDGVPRFIVDGKFVVDVASAGSPERLISLLDYLTALEHKR